MGFVTPGQEVKEESNKALTFDQFVADKTDGSMNSTAVYTDCISEEVTKWIENYVRYRIEFSRR